ncbi:MAG TPA: aminotransferase class V-fold PLP-dependent enzyme [Candidatus Limnocylindria bacterium]|nr:aminotransferase class V-fold PLP-dependent enzyme [Candidatus Limnocylindria bacterium]
MKTAGIASGTMAPAKQMRTPSRSDFELPEGEVYLNGGFQSPLPRAARAAVEDAYRLKAWPFTTPDDAQLRMPDAARERLGRVMGVPADQIGVTTSTSFGAMLMAQGIRCREGDRVLLGPDEFPGNVYPWLALEERGVRVEFIGVAGRPLAPEQLAEALQAPGRVRALAVAAIHYVTGDVHPLAELAALLRSYGAHMIVDAAQALGAVAIDWAGSGADAVLASGYKWLYGPSGSGAIWVKPSFREQLLNVNGNWLALEAAEDFGAVMKHYPRAYAAHGRRFDVGQAASHLNLAALGAGLDYLLSIGVSQVEAHHRSLQDAVVDAVAGMPLELVTRLDTAHRGPLLMLAPDASLDLPRLCSELTRRSVHVSLRGGRMRVSPGVWNDESDVRTFSDVVSELLPACRKV